MKTLNGTTEPAKTLNRAGVMVVFPGSTHPNAMDAWLARRGVPEGKRWVCPTALPDGAPVTIFYGGR